MYVVKWSPTQPGRGEKGMLRMGKEKVERIREAREGNGGGRKRKKKEGAKAVNAASSVCESNEKRMLTVVLS